MTATELLISLERRGVSVSSVDGNLRIDHQEVPLTADDIARLKHHKQELVELLRPTPTPAPLGIDQWEEISPEIIPTCWECQSLCDVETVAGTWHCSRCDPDAESRRLKTEQLLALSRVLKAKNKRMAKGMPTGRGI